MAADSFFNNNDIDKSKAYQVLNSNLSSADDNGFLNLDNTYAAMLLDNNEKRVVALLVVHKYAPTLAYCCLSTVDETISDVRLSTEESDVSSKAIKHLRARKIIDVKELQDRTKEPLWKTHHIRKRRTPHENMFDMAILDALGSHNLELKKNVTIDVIETSDLTGDRLYRQLEMWRDRVGFYVLDSHELYEVIVPASRVAEFVDNVSKSTSGEYPIKSDFNTIDLINYDRKVTSFEREEYLNYLRGIRNAHFYMADTADGGNISVGVAGIYDGTLMFMYAESDGAAAALLRAIGADWPKEKSLTFSSQHNRSLYQIATSMGSDVQRHRIHRFHTVSPPDNIAWESVYAFNCGVNIV